MRNDLSDIKDLFDLDPSVLHLNPGAFGVVPREVRAAQRAWSDRIEANAVRFFRLECHDELARVRERVTGFLGTSSGSTALVRNVSEAVGVILPAIDLGPGDEVVVSNHGYPTVATAAERRGASVRVAQFGIDATDAQIAAAFAAEVGERTKLVVVDQVTSPTGLLLPLQQVIEAVAPVPVYVDGAHAAGTLDLAVEDYGAAFWATNLHKWCYTPRGTGALWVAPQWRERAHPAVTSWTHDGGFPAAHDFSGTIDFTPMLAIPAGLDFWAAHGGPRIAHDLRELLDRGTRIVRDALGERFPDQPVVAPDWPRRTAPTMRVVALPPSAVPDADTARKVYARMSAAGVECPPTFFDGTPLLRLGAQLYTDETDYRRCAEVLFEALSASSSS